MPGDGIDSGAHQKINVELEYNTVWDKYREPQVLKGGKDYSKHPWKEKYDEEKNRNPVLHLCSY